VRWRKHPGQEAQQLALALEALAGAYAERTVRECAYEFRRIRGWCEARGHGFFPLSPEAAGELVDFYFESSAVSTVEGRLWMIRLAHAALDLPDPTRSEAVKLAFRRGARMFGSRRRRARSRQATPINAELMARLEDACGADLIGLRDRAMLSLGYDTLCRQGELVALQVQDIEVLEDGSARILVRCSKADPFGRGEYVYLTVRGLAHLEAWLERADLVEGPILRGVYFGERVGRGALHTRTLITRLRALAEAAGLPPADARSLGGHSMRVGAAQDLAIRGATLSQIMRAGRWRSLESVAHYIREAPINVWSALEARGATAWREAMEVARTCGSLGAPLAPETAE
jgi:integrase